MCVVAAIDMGSHAVRLVIWSLGVLGNVREQAFFRWPLRLGESVYAHGMISTQCATELRTVFEDIAAELENHHVSLHSAMATAALRDAANAVYILQDIEDKTGIDVAVIHGRKEGALSRKALLNKLGRVPSNTLFLDLGGGSLELQRADTKLRRSLPFGSLRILQQFPKLSHKLSRNQIDSLVGQIGKKLRCNIPQMHLPLAAGTGGNLDALARLVPGPRHFFPCIEPNKLKPLMVRIAGTQPKERASVFGLRKDRADVILPASIVVMSLTKFFRVQKWLVPQTGHREAVLQTLTDKTRDGRATKRFVQCLKKIEGGQTRMMRNLQSAFVSFAPAHGLHPLGLGPLLGAGLLRCLSQKQHKYFDAQNVTFLKKRGLTDEQATIANDIAMAIQDPSFWGNRLASRKTMKYGDTTFAAKDAQAFQSSVGLLQLATAMDQEKARGIEVDFSKFPIAVHVQGFGNATQKTLMRLAKQTGVRFQLT